MLEESMQKQTTKLLMEFFCAYFRMLKEERGALAVFAKENKIPKWTISRILGGDPAYLPKMDTILKILEGIRKNPPIDVQKRLHIGANGSTVLLQELLSKGATKLAVEDMEPLLKMADILSYKHLIDPALLATLLNLLVAVHAQINTALANPHKDVVIKLLSS